MVVSVMLLVERGLGCCGGLAQEEEGFGAEFVALHPCLREFAWRQLVGEGVLGRMVLGGSVGAWLWVDRKSVV